MRSCLTALLAVAFVSIGAWAFVLWYTHTSWPG